MPVSGSPASNRGSSALLMKGLGTGIENPLFLARWAWTYFRIKHEKHNLDRARNQMKLVRDMEQKMPRMNEIIESYL